MKKLTEVEKAYLAGIIDGEGCIGIGKYKRKNNIQPFQFGPRVVITNTDLFLINELRKMYPVFTFWKRKFTGKRQKKICYNLNISNQKEIVEFLNDILPYLFSKKEQAQLVIKFCQLRQIKKMSPYKKEEIEIYEKVKSLKL